MRSGGQTGRSWFNVIADVFPGYSWMRLSQLRRYIIVPHYILHKTLHYLYIRISRLIFEGRFADRERRVFSLHTSRICIAVFAPFPFTPSSRYIVMLCETDQCRGILSTCLSPSFAVLSRSFLYVSIRLAAANRSAKSCDGSYIIYKLLCNWAWSPDREKTLR